jgi:hypothetical protein
MAYSDFKTIDSVKRKLKLKVRRDKDLFAEVEVVEPSHLLKETLKENVPLALAIHSEKARSEMIVAPILIEIRRRLDHRISLFSGLEFNVDREKDLKGVCDFILSLSPEQMSITAPVINIVEAKNDNIKSGIPQCLAEMFAAKIFNEKNENPVDMVYGIVTTGSIWQFLELSDSTAIIDLTEYYLRDLDKIIGIILHLLEDALRKFTPQ